MLVKSMSTFEKINIETIIIIKWKLNRFSLQDYQMISFVPACIHSRIIKVLNHYFAQCFGISSSILDVTQFYLDHSYLYSIYLISMCLKILNISQFSSLIDKLDQKR